MKNLKMIFAAFMMMAFAITLNAQSTVGFRGGINLANYNKDIMPSGFMTDQQQKPMLGIDAAIFANLEILSNFSIQPEIHWIQKGVKITGKNTSDNMDLEMVYKYNYLEVPVLARFNFVAPSETIGFNIFVGSSVGYALDGKYKGTNVSSEAGIEKGGFETDLEWDDEYGTDGTKSQRWDVGATGGVGIEVMTDVVNVVFDARYSMDFTDIVKYETTPSPRPDKIYNRGFAFTVGLAFPIGF